eukprot:scaffold203233_cov21-Tisochrysis_lutea.AAC.2
MRGAHPWCPATSLSAEPFVQGEQIEPVIPSWSTEPIPESSPRLGRWEVGRWPGEVGAHLKCALPWGAAFHSALQPMWKAGICSAVLLVSGGLGCPSTLLKVLSHAREHPGALIL